MTLEERITEALREPVAPDLRTALDLRVRTAIDSTPLRRRRRFGLRRGLLLAALLALALPGVITGGIYLSENPFGLAGANEFAAEIAAAKLVVPLPPGRSWPDFFRVTDPSAGYGRGGAQPWAEGIAMCLWFDEWLDARTAGDAAREAAAAQTISEIPTWPSWDSVHYDQSVRDYYGPVITAVEEGDEGPVRRDMGTNCSWANEE